MSTQRPLLQIPLDHARCAGRTINQICDRRERCARYTDTRIQPTTQWGCKLSADNFIDNAPGETA